MTVVILERAHVSLRGVLTRWMLEVKVGVFVGTLSSRVRERLWEVVCARNKEGGCVLIHSTPCEQGFAVQTHGDTSRLVVDMEGLTLVKRA